MSITITRNMLDLYHRLPYPLKVMIASGRGYYLRRWRYGPETDQLVRHALERENWPPEKWQAWQAERLARVLDRAVRQVPYYRNYWAERRRKGDHASPEQIENWPVLTKEILRQHMLEFVADDRDPSKLFADYTSGTSGKPLTIRSGLEAQRLWYALFEARVRLWNGISRHDAWAIYGQQLVVPVSQKKPPFWVWNAGLRQLYFSAYHLDPRYIEDQVKALQKHNVRYILGYASSLHTVARFVKQAGLKMPHLEVVISNSEPLYAHQRALMEEVFGTRVVDTYGQGEMVASGSECEYGTMHLWPDAGLIEVFDDFTDQPAPAGQAGRFIVTGLVNDDQPLIRYELGDRGALAPAGTCQCGRTLPIIASLEGRMDDVIVTADGRRIGRLDSVLKVEVPVEESQIIQEDINTIRMLVVPSPGFNQEHEELLLYRLRSRIGAPNITIEHVESIPREKNGKFKAVVSRVKDDPQGQVEQAAHS